MVTEQKVNGGVRIGGNGVPKKVSVREPHGYETLNYGRGEKLADGTTRVVLKGYLNKYDFREFVREVKVGSSQLTHAYVIMYAMAHHEGFAKWVSDLNEGNTPLVRFAADKDSIFDESATQVEEPGTEE